MAAYQDRSCEGIPGQSPRLKGRGHDIEEFEHDYIGRDVMISKHSKRTMFQGYDTLDDDFLVLQLQCIVLRTFNIF